MKKINILHIEDDPNDAGLVARELRKDDLVFSQKVISTKEEFLQSLQEGIPDIILSDHSMPAFNSLEALKLVHQQKLNVPFILITGNSSEEFAVSVIKEGADDYILKDRMKRLPAAIKNVLKKYELTNAQKKIEAETALKEQATLLEMQKLTNRLRMATKSAGMGIWEWNIKTNELLWDEGMFKIYNINANKFAGNYNAWASTVHQEDHKRIEEGLQLAIDGKKDYDLEFRIIWPDFSIRYIKAAGIIEKDESGNLLKMIGINWDITKDKEAEILVKESEAKYRSLVESSMDAILLTNKYGNVLSANIAACNMFKMSLPELCSLETSLIDRTDNRLPALLQEREINGKTIGELNFVRKDGSIFPGEITSAVFTNADGEERTSITIRDISARKAAEQALIDSEAFSRGVLDSLRSHIAVVNTSGLIIKVNKPWKVFALKNGAKDAAKCGVGANYFDSFCLDIVEDQFPAREALAGIKKVINGTLKEFYWEYPCHSPVEQRWFYMRVMKFEGAETLLLIEHQYITERVLATKKIEESERKYRRILETAQEGIWMIDSYNKTNFVNQRICKLLGYTQKEMLNLPITTFISKEQLQASAFRNTGNISEPNDGYTSLVTKDGRQIWVVLSTNPIRNEDGEFEGILAMVNDVTDRKIAEEKLRENQEQLIESQRIAQIGSWHINLSDTQHVSNCTINCSDETFRIFGFLPNKLNICYHSFSKFIHISDRKPLQDSIEEIIKSKGSYTTELRIEDKCGNNKWVQLQAQVAADSITGQAYKIFGTIKDITLRKEQELKIKKNSEEREILIAELTRSLKDLKQFSYITSHNFRAPLSNLVGLLNLVDTSTLTPDNKAFFEMFNTSTLQLSRTIDDLVKILIIKNEVNVDIADNNLDLLIDNLENSFTQEILCSRCSISRNFEVENIHFNPSYLESILSNLLSNSLKYYHHDRPLQIDISTKRKADGDVLMIIKDNGRGIDLKRHADKIFGLYQRFHSDPVGIGLGLFMVKSQVTALGGTIEIESEEGVGTSFLISIKSRLSDVNYPETQPAAQNHFQHTAQLSYSKFS